MAWKKQSVGGFLIATETLTLPTGAATDSETSVIDFIPFGRGFYAVINTGATNLASAATTDIVGAVGAGGTYETLVKAFAADCDTATKISKFRPKRDDVSLGGASRLKIALKHGGNQTGESVTIALVVDMSESDCLSK